MALKEKCIKAVFHPQAWYRGYAIEVDPNGPVEFDVTEEILKMGKDAALQIKDDDFASDDLKFAMNAPEWICNWDGPFYIEVRQAIRDYFDSGLAEDRHGHDTCCCG